MKEVELNVGMICYWLFIDYIDVLDYRSNYTIDNFVRHSFASSGPAQLKILSLNIFLGLLDPDFSLNSLYLVFQGENKYSTIQKVKRGTTNSRVAFFEEL